MDAATREVLHRYASEIRQLPNESAKTHRFAGLVGELFRGTVAVTELSRGVEKRIRIDLGARKKAGRVDAYYGNAVIEFENSLRNTLEVAQEQLREYTSGIWNKEGADRPLLCIATDGLTWITYRPALTEGHSGRIKPSHITLEHLRTLEISEQTLSDFWLWLTGLLFRSARTFPSTEAFKLDFGASSLAFADSLDSLSKTWEKVKSGEEQRLKFDTWKKYLTFTYGSLGDASDLETLFLKHTYLASIARFLVWASLSRGRTTIALRDVAREVLSGRYFESQGIENLVEDDFFQWIHETVAESSLAPVFERLLSQLLTYDLAQLSADVLKGVYQELVDPKDRHELGEYYTPEWLCEAIIEKELPKKGFVSVLDPTCGSGSFLRAAIAHMIAANPSGGDASRLRSILEHVAGIDIHPLAVTIARATYTLALGSLVKATKRPIQIPVYLADSLFLPAEVRQLELGSSVPGYEIRFGGNRKVTIPETLVHRADLFDTAIAACTRLALDHANSGGESEHTLSSYLGRVLPSLAGEEEYPDMLAALWAFTSELADLIKKRRNSIWGFIVRNAYRPAMLKGRFDFIVGNPPWLSYRNISDPEYQAEVKKRAISDYAIAPTSQELLTQMELATVFLVHSLETFGRKGSRLAFVMPRSVLSADQHVHLRNKAYAAQVLLESYWDLLDVRPVFNVPSCVLFASRKPISASVSYTLPAVEWSGELDGRDLPWSEAQQTLSTVSATAHLIYLGERTALSTTKGRTKPNYPSSYAGRFKDGATVYPRNFYFVRIPDLDGKPDIERNYWAESDPEQALSAKEPYKGVVINGQVEGQFIYRTALSKHVLPFLFLPPSLTVLPLIRARDGLRTLSPKELRAEGHREIGKWMEKVERVWTQKRGKKANQTATEYLDYQNKLIAQDFARSPLVVYNASGTDLSAAVVEPSRFGKRLVVDHKLYWMEARDLEEAYYITAILNSDTVNMAIKPFQSMGLLGERDIHKKVLDLPIPSFKASAAAHQRLASLGQQASDAALETFSAGNMPRSLARARGVVRSAIQTILEMIDEVVEKLVI